MARFRKYTSPNAPKTISAHDAGSAFERSDVLVRQQLYIGQAYATCNLIVHTAHGIVQTGVGGINGNALTDSLNGAALHECTANDSLQRMEQQRMMGNDQVQPLRCRLGNHVFRDVQT